MERESYCLGHLHTGEAVCHRLRQQRQLFVAVADAVDFAVAVDVDYGQEKDVEVANARG